ncbi:sodium-dependent transporter [Pseudoscardovia suis]
MSSTETTAVDKGKKRSNFTGRIGYVMAAAGSAIGLGNIWRFPYLAAKYGGAVFLIVYLISVYTFGYVLIMSETVIGRKTKKSPVSAFRHFGNTKAHSFGGWINAIIPMLIAPYYSVIGGWVLYYLFSYIQGEVKELGGDNAFTNFISSGTSVEFWFLVFAVCTIAVIFFGVQNGVERVSKVLLPLLVVLSVIVCIYSCTRPGAVEGIKYFFIPQMQNVSWMTFVTAIGQMFYSLSCAMGILITYGSYMKRDVSIEKSTTQVEFFDTLIAVLAGLMIIPAVFAFNGADAAKTLKAGPSLMFITMPKVFGNMGFGMAIGIVFFLLVFLAALTSSISLMESAVSTFQDELGMSRPIATLTYSGIYIVLGTLSSLGFNVLGGVKLLGMDFLDFFDFITNSVMMPIAAIAICLLVLRSVTLKGVEDEVTYDGAPFKRKKVYNFVIKYLCIVFLVIILVSSVLNAFGIIKM